MQKGNAKDFMMKKKHFICFKKSFKDKSADNTYFSPSSFSHSYLVLVLIQEAMKLGSAQHLLTMATKSYIL